MVPHDRRTDYLLGSTDAEHDRLIRQAVRLAPITDQLFREAGIGPGQQVLDLGSGVGDVAILLARIVGPAGRIVGIERDPRSIRRARQRVGELGLDNVTFREIDIAHFASDASFDAAVGRFVLQFLPDPVSALRAVARAVRPGGAVAFQEGSWAPFVLLSRSLPLWSASVSLMRDVSLRAGVREEMGLALFQAFQDAGLPAPRMRLEMELGHDPDFTRWVSDAVRSLGPRFQEFNMPIDALGDLDTLQDRLQREVASANTVVPWLAMVSAWSRLRAS
jgi:SAM-dependent methyltransferase